MPEPIEALRERYADEIMALARSDKPELRRAFASVPREAHCGPGPWTLIDGGLKRRATPDADPRHLYANVLVALDEAKQLNNGQPQFWATMFDALQPAAGERAIHVGAGGGYYTAILAELVGPTGRVTGIEYEPELAAAAASSLAPRPNVEFLAGDAHNLVEGSADVIVASCGFDVIPVAWVRLLREGGRLLMPLTAPSGMAGIGLGAMLLVTRNGVAFDARFLSGTMIYDDKAGRTDAATKRLAAAFPSASLGQTWVPPAVASLRLEGAPDASCWLAGEGWWLSTTPALA